MEEHARDRRRAPQYPGEDTRLTSEKELRGFYSYSWAVEVFVVCGIGSFIPITLEQLARESKTAVLLSDRSIPCSGSIVAPVLNGTNAIIDILQRAVTPENKQCVITLLGSEINTSSFALYTFAISVALQTLIVISMSGLCDHGEYRKKMLLTFAFTGAIATMLFLAITPSVYVIAALLAIVGNFSFGASFVLLNSFLPLLVRYHPSTQKEQFDTSSEEDSTDRMRNSAESEEGVPQETTTDSSSTLIPTPTGSQSPVSSSDGASPQLLLSTRISSYGIGIGYSAAVLVQVLSVGILLLMGSSTFSLRVVLFVIGAWWAIFTVPAAMWLRPRPGPPLPSYNEKKQSWLRLIGFSWASIGRTILRARELKDMIFFLAAWFFISDSIASVSGTAVLFAKTELSMPPSALALISVVVTIAGVLGAFTWNRLALEPRRTILWCILLFETIPLYCLLGFVPAVERLGFLGLQQPWEVYLLAFVYGFVLGGLSSVCRSLYGELVPPGFESQFYSLYSITDKGSSIFGPSIIGVIIDQTGEQRNAFWFLAVLIAAPFPLMYFVDARRGKSAGERLARELEGSAGSDGGSAVEDEVQGLLGDRNE